MPFIENYVVEMAKHTDASPVFHRATAYTILGALLTREAHRTVTAYGCPPVWTNLWTLLVGDSGSGHKSTAINMGATILAGIEPAMVGPNEMSPEGFLGYMQRREKGFEQADTEQQAAPRPGDASTILVQSEFGNLMLQFARNYAASLKTILLELYDVPLIPYRRTLKKQVVEIDRPRVSLLGGIATELLASYAEPEDWLGGFFSRCLILTGPKVREQRDLPEIPPAAYENQIEELQRMLLHRGEKLSHEGWPRVAFDAKAKELLGELPPPPEEMQLQISLSRASTHLVKLAAIEQFDSDPLRLTVGKPAVQRALDFLLNHWWKNLPEIVDACFTRSNRDLEGDRLAKRILRYITRHEGKVARSTILRNLCLRARDVSDAMQALGEAEYVKAVQDEADGTLWYELTDRGKGEGAKELIAPGRAPHG